MLVGLRLICACILFILQIACSKNGHNIVNANKLSENSQATNIEIKTPSILDDEKIKGALLKYMQENDCRIAEPKDFSFTESAMNEIKNIVGDYRIQTIAYDDFDGTRPLNDFAVILVNRNDFAPNFFRLVFFLEKPDGYQSIVMFNHKNLSKSTFLKQSKGWYLVTYDKNDSRKSCFFTWNAKEQIFRCNDNI